MNGGRVYLVGAGPGDPALLTRKAVAYLRRADLVLYDALVDERVVQIARRAQRKKWRAEAVAMPERRPLLLQALNQLYAERPQ